MVEGKANTSWLLGRVKGWLMGWLDVWLVGTGRKTEKRQQTKRLLEKMRILVALFFEAGKQGKSKEVGCFMILKNHSTKKYISV